MSFRNALRLSCSVVCVVLLAGCSDEQPKVDLPEGVQKLSGIVTPAEISLVRRGSHLLIVDGAEKYFIESPEVSLRRYEHKEVELEGILEHNISEDYLPVLVVQNILSVVEEESKDWSVHSLGVTIEVPASWNGIVTASRADFSTPGGTGTLMSIFAEDIVDEEDVPIGTPIVVGQKRAVRQMNEATGNQRVVVTQETRHILFTFTPGDREDADQLRAQWLKALNNIRFSSSAQPTTPTTGSGTSGAGMPCGGTAGILCPAGLYCDITSIEENIGVCKGI